MKKCPQCGKIYDDSWSVCLNDKAALTDAPEVQAGGAGTEEAAPKKNVWNRPLSGNGVELAIGQYFLNRVGVLSLVAGFAFFIAYSFQFIGVWGKLLLGFAAAGTLLGLGKFLERKPGMQWYGFGLIGGGWGLGYFTAYAMHHIEAVRVITDPSFALLALVLVTSLMMADMFRYRSQAVTTLVYLLAFFTAGIGKLTPFSLVYAALLTFSLVLVIYKMKWNRLMIFAVLASYATHVYWLGPEILLSSAFMDGPAAMSRLLLSAGFLSLYGILFGIAPLLTNQESDEDRHVQTATTLLNAFLFSVCLFREVDNINPAWKFEIAVALGVLHLLVLYAAKYSVKRDHLVIANMSLAISFFTVSFPLKYTDQWVHIAWLAEVPVLIYLGLQFKRIVYRAFAWGLGMVMTLKLAALYGPFSSAPLPILDGFLTDRSMTVWFGVLLFSATQAIYLFFKKKTVLLDGESSIGRGFFAVALYLLLALSLNDLHANWISIVWAAAAFVFFAAGFGMRDRWFRYAALTLVCLIVGRVALYDVRDLPTIYRIVLFMGMGVSLLVASFIYGRIALSKNKDILQ